MKEISCDVCLDLMPLVRDGVASEDSRGAVEAHIAGCESCRNLYAGEKLPAADREKALSKAVKRVQAVSIGVLIVIVLLGVWLVEGIMEGSSVFFLLAVWILIRLVQFARKKENSGIKKVLAIIGALALIWGLAALGNTLFGNPVSKARAETVARAYLQGKFPDEDYYVEELSYDTKVGRYKAEVRSPGSVDTYFAIDIRPDGTVRYDTYESNVLTGWNTADRLDREYRNLVEPVLHRLNLNYRAYVSCDPGFEWVPYNGDPDLPQYLLNGEALRVDGSYDLVSQSALTGHLRVTVEQDAVSAEAAAQILLDVKGLMQEAGLAFYSIDLTLRHPMPENGAARPGNSVRIENFLYENIYEEGLLERVRDAKEEA